ncbi:MAG: hypothetical protein IPL65_06975 [Lewinellaceae bacterium]|nr:hypothetical protein [Lewinellaceae bacterium]
MEREYEAFAENLRWSLTRDQIIAKNNIEVTDAELREDYAKRVRQYFQVDLPDHLIEGSVDRLMKDQKEIDETRRNLETDKLFEVIRSLVTISDKPIDSKAFNMILEEVTQKAEQTQAAAEAIDADIVE